MIISWGLWHLEDPRFMLYYINFIFTLVIQGTRRLWFFPCQETSIILPTLNLWIYLSYWVFSRLFNYIFQVIIPVVGSRTLSFLPIICMLLAMILYFFPLVIALAKACGIHAIRVICSTRNRIHLMIVVDWAWVLFINFIHLVCQFLSITNTCLLVPRSLMNYAFFIWHW